LRRTTLVVEPSEAALCAGYLSRWYVEGGIWCADVSQGIIASIISFRVSRNTCIDRDDATGRFEATGGFGEWGKIYDTLAFSRGRIPACFIIIAGKKYLVVSH